MNKIKLDHITLKSNLALYKLADYVGIPTDDLINKVLLHLVKLEYIIDDKNACGLLLIEILGINQYEIRYFCQNMFKIWTPKLETYLNDIYIWGNYDCPECGCKLNYPELYNENLGVCNNCGYDRGRNFMPELTNKCHKELINQINCN